jgi:Bacterial protein of unknown function (DUF916)
MNPGNVLRATLAATACVVAMAASTMPANAAAASPAGAILSVSPAHPDPLVASGNSYFVHGVAPGGTWTDEVAVVNTGDLAINAWVDPVDGITSARTGAVYSARTIVGPGAGTWVRPHVSSVTVPAHARTIVGFTVSVPVGAHPGDHLAGIAFESKHGSSSGSSVAITTVLRSVVAVQVRVPGPADFHLRVYSATVSAVSTTGTSGIALDMEDVGGLLGKPRLEIALDGPLGYHRFETLKLDTMLPGDRITDEILWPDALAAGDYRLTVTEDGSGRHGAPLVSTAHLAAALHPSAPAQTSVVTQAVAGNSFPAWVLFGGIAAGAGFTALPILIVASARRRRRSHPGR